jgi:putative transposon-encoded protein
MKRFFDNTVGLLKMYMKQKYLRIKKLIETVLVPYFKKYGASSRITVDIHRKIDIALTDTYLPDKVINNYKKVDLR